MRHRRPTAARSLRCVAILCALGAFACDDRSPASPEPGSGRDAAAPPPDAMPVAPGDAMVDAMNDAAVDAMVEAAADATADAIIDAMPDAIADATPAPACPPFRAPPPEGRGLPDVRLRAALPFGAPPGVDALRVVDLDGDPAAAPEVVVARGGRLEVSAADGAGWWRSPVLDVERIVAAADLDGDGRRELVAAARRAVFAFDALTGALRWTLPDAPFGDARPLVAVQQARLIDLDGDGLDELYASDSGCGDDGTGRAAVFGFVGPFGAPRATVDGPRLNGRCARWHTFADVDPPGDGRPELLVTDGDGLNAFDPLTGARRLCGAFAAPPNGPLPHARAAGGWFVFLPDAVGFAAVDPAGACPDGEGAIALRARVELPGVQPEGSGLDLDGALITAALDPATGRWRTLRITADGAVGRVRDDARLLGLPDPAHALVALGEPAAPAPLGAVQLLDLTADPPADRWPAPAPRARPIRGVAAADRTPELAPSLTLGGDVLLLRAEGDAVDRIERRGLDGAVRAERLLFGDPGAVVAAPGGLGVGEAGGRVAVLDEELRPRHLAADDRPPVRAAAGAPTLAVAFDGRRPRPVGLIGGVLALLDPDREAAPIRWQAAVGVPGRGGSPLAAMPRGGDRADLLLVRDARAGDAAWAAIDAADGARVWRHGLEPSMFRPVGDAQVVRGPDGAAEIVARADLVLRPADWPDADPDCAETVRAHPEPAAPDPACPGFEVKPRVVRGLDAETGACRWRLVLRPAFPCGGPSNQALSAADGDGDGRPELYLTESDALRAIDPLTGALRATAGLGRHANGSVRGGGWIRGDAAGLARLGGNGPVEGFDAGLAPRWAAENPEGLRLQGWIGRDGAVAGGAVWLSPAAGFPLVGWRLDDGAMLAAVGLSGGEVHADAPLAPDHADVRALAAVEDVDGAGADGLLAVTDDGVLWALTADGAPAWSRPHDAAIGAPVVAALEPDGARAVLVPAADGRVLVYGPPGPAAPPAAWDLPCPPAPSCDAADDIDRTERTDRLCAAWVPVAGAERHEARVVGPNGAIIADWRPAEPPLDWPGLSLVPGLRYAVEVRAVAEVDGARRRSAPRATDGVEVVNDAPPTVRLSARPDRLSWAEQPVTITLVAEDDDRLAGWRVDVLGPDGALVRRLGASALAHRVFETDVRWNLEDPAKRPVPPGRYRAVASVVDRAGHTARAEAPVEVCPAPCR